ncbi:bifunctional [glutamate--ammonia ligase]-adenylyl-L-tyrosine phosphorylase/[glutamate--ammonia-ligase] adenylyltransferase [Inhella gelatinilytica]|uniref:Bifunctional glutamine synthetase adenylyltransferase/adenylyl-removing enzyme n=1 Tax=Inhella gelatinilytica TaxID=2795030 RepID=A0A931IUE6_9BURK|nr:bifunctional [glutamate--ammonia ligase]-adenylyl-L-tyrosine phosphorylase/[glutamate--ammonia-ligase] adenylyltransferase [Inhella gelatinilytica]MBH9551711.1 bifunctional [glutamate--ammonia ligase]-adenylyl-L-tyrosine phosphorylase/[glutamate--ammonia-ligase] adenylyltransferase [Inhella gelatinilytica]
MGSGVEVSPLAQNFERTADAAAHSRFVQRIRRRYAAELERLPAGPLTEPVLRHLIDGLQAAGRPLPAALRVARQLWLERLATEDCAQRLPVAAVTAAMTLLAEVTLDIAVQTARSELSERHGQLLGTDGQEVAFWVVGMGKLGARELNVSSDIDLIYIYEEEVESTGPVPLSSSDYFARVAKRLTALIGDVTEDGQVFRMDLALRPNGNSGPPACSLAALETYFYAQGREWERLAWLKSRVVAPRDPETLQRAQQLRQLVTPFVYRRYLDYSVFEGLRQIHRMIREEAQRRAAGRPERANDVKLSRGGIREIEFIVQLLQVVRGGQFPEIRTRSTVKALDRLAAAGLMNPVAAQALAADYALLRQVEHRIQYLDDQQTHCLPSDDADLRWIAETLGLVCKPEACELFERLCETRERVAAEFDALLHDGRSGPSGACKGCGSAPELTSEDFLARLPEPLQAGVRRFVEQPRVQALKDSARQRLAQLFQRAGQLVVEGGCEEQAAARFVDWVEPLLRREAYLAMLVERPAVLSRLLRLLGLARWPMRYLMQHPGVIDELADARLLHERFDAEAFKAELAERHDAWVRAGEADEEALLDALRRAHHAEVFRTLVRDVEGRITVEQVADDLSALADAVLQVAIDWCWARLAKAHQSRPQFAVIAYGKLGGKELGYGSDLDVVFLYDDPHEDAAEVYAAFVRKLVPWLTLQTRAGGLFDIDTALRPNGHSGLLVSSLRSFAAYQEGRGSNTAWTWEHQAITRARWCAGDAALQAPFEAVREGVMRAPREAAALKGEVHAMRDKMRQANPVRAGRFDLKHSAGGMLDVEFALQALQLLQSDAHPELIPNLGVIALLRRAEAAALLAPGLGQAASDAYRELRRAQHRLRLDEQPTHLDEAELGPLGAHRAAVHALWAAVFPPEPAA